MTYFIFVATLIQILIMLVFLLIAIAFITLLERKILAVSQRRQGPNVIGVFGLLQPLADGFKLMLKESVFPSNSNKYLFALAPIISFFVSLMGWAVIPFSSNAILADLDASILYSLGASALGIYGIIIAGWSSNSKYSFLGSLRSSAQMLAYELPLYISILTVMIMAGTQNYNDIVETQRNVWFFFPLSISAGIFFICSLAETNRHPFDLPEAESELVAGYAVEYSAMGFALFSLAEYSNILFMCSLNTTLFFGGWQAPLAILTFVPGAVWFGLKTTFISILFIYARATLPRYRYDQLMRLGWKVLLPLSFAHLFFVISILYTFNLFR